MAKNIPPRTSFDSLLDTSRKLDRITLEECRARCLHEETKRKCRAKVYAGKEHDKCEFYCMTCGADCNLPDAQCVQEIHVGIVINGERIPKEAIVTSSPVLDAPLLAQTWAHRLVMAYQNLEVIAKRENTPMLMELKKELKPLRNTAAHTPKYDWRTSSFINNNGDILRVADLPRLITQAEYWQGI